MTVDLNLSAAPYTVRAEGGDAIQMVFTVKATNTAGWVLEFRFFESDSGGSGPTGSILTALTLTVGSGIVNTPNTTGGNSTIAITIPVSTTIGRSAKPYYTDLVRTDASRTLAKGPVILQ